MRDGLIDVDGVADLGFGISEDLEEFRSETHRHAKHQLLYAKSGTMILTSEGRRWILPPQQAAWIRAETDHAVSSTTGIALRTVYLARDLVRDASLPPRGCCVFAVTPLAREMVLHAMRWSPAEHAKAGSSTPPDPTRDAFFRALAGLLEEWVRAPSPLYLPEPKSPELARATAWTLAHLADATVEGAAAAAHVSVRTLSRRFEDEVQISFRTYLQTARMMRALELLASKSSSVTTTAFEVGFRSAGAFATAFQERCGETPSAYRARVTGIGAPDDVR